MSDNDIEKIQRLTVPRGAIRPKLQPVPVSDYRSVVRQIERRDRRDRARAAIAAEMREEEAARRVCYQRFWVGLLCSLLLLAITMALMYSPLCQNAAVAFLKFMRELLGL
ncbi:uncharacterized protein TM35_000063920 [Trypanosoma theileri]|uniref:Transmembrane protein n=1 Tax=Trypanosoma theileri TaxID=67003 RepID=A0A1X0P387_9TRYP|nr:uncharacterized protein TM35_000063920 [Trypanosoma theileri]ORC91387.1 hypothetical protein TM35_000063920 [Trypanosoma theileri]